MSPWHTAALLAVIWAVTFALRAAPFAASRWLRDNDFVRDLGLLLPVGVMAVLVVGMLQDTPWDGWGWVPSIGGVVATAVLHFWRDSVLLSLVGGIATYGILLLVVP
jgi:branched-subunit amino acid transport protein AzlD